jgi:hypothetical protein
MKQKVPSQKPEGKKPLGRSRRRQEDNVKIDFRTGFSWYPTTSLRDVITQKTSTSYLHPRDNPKSRTDSSRSGQGPARGSKEHINAPSSSTERGCDVLNN